jgi:GT2 family glycosyltransferase
VNAVTPEPGIPPVPKYPSCAIIILNYNGIEHLEHLLPTCLAASDRFAADHGARVPVVVADNRSTKPDVQYIRDNFPAVEVIVSETNDYLFSLNPIVAARPEEVIILLNNDMRVEPDFIAPLLEPFRSPTVFVTVPRILDWEGKVVTNGQRLFDVNGFVFKERFDAAVENMAYSLEAGCGGFRRSMYVELGGFDTLFRPGYWEDVDLAYRAWARGWQCLYVPASVIYHKVGATFGLDHDRPQLYHKNYQLFVTKNIGGWGFLIGQLVTLPVRALRTHRTHDVRDQFAAFRKAVPRLPLAVWRRLQSMGPKRRHHEIANALRAPVRLES